MEKYLKAYGVFVAMTLVTALVIRPLVRQVAPNVPLINQL